MRPKRIIVLLIFLSLFSVPVQCQSDLDVTVQLLKPILSKTNVEGKKFCTKLDSIVSFDEPAFNSNGPTLLLLELSLFYPTVTMLYNKGFLSEILISNIVDTSSLYQFYNSNNVYYCGLFQMYAYTKTDYKKPGWSVHFKFANNKNSRINAKCEVETLDSTSYYTEVLKNQIYEYKYGVSCDESEEPPLGRYAIHYMKRKNLITSITNLKDFTNNEGLMYICEYYVRNKIKLPEEFRSIQNKKIDYCDGYMDFGTMTIGKMAREIKDGTSTFSDYFTDESW